jgi:hypothetical protein
MLHAFLIAIGIIAAIALAPVVFAVLRNPFFWIVSIITGFTGIAVFVVWALATAPHQKTFAEQRYEQDLAEAQAALTVTATKAHGKTQLEIDAQRQHEIDAQYLTEAQTATQRWNEAQVTSVPTPTKAESSSKKSILDMDASEMAAGLKPAPLGQ